MEYEDFLKTKEIRSKSYGFDIELSDLNNYLFDYQKEVVKWALKKGKACIFAECGMGKTAMQIEWINQITKNKNCKGLILAPLSVSTQTIKEAEKMNVKINNLRKGESGTIDIINYEYLENVNFENYNAIVLDESSIIKSFMGKTKQLIFSMFKDYQFKLACTATPSPNDQMELLNHAEFVDQMKSNEALAIWYINDTMNFGQYRIKKHAEADFWKWVSSWAVSFSNPSDIGFDGSKYVLPKLNEMYIEVQAEIKNDTDNMFSYKEISATNYNSIKREVIDYKIKKIVELVKNIPENEQIVIWCYTNQEADELKKVIKNSVEIRGNDSNDKKETEAMKFVNGETRILISKPSIFGFGMNFQNCRNVIYCGLSFSYEEYYQSIRRFYRFGQKKDVNAYIVLSDHEKQIYKIVNEKSILHAQMKSGMVFSNNDFFEMQGKREYKMNYIRDEFKTDNFTLINGDCIEEIKILKDDSVDFSIFSPPFSQLYIYSDSYRDMGNCKNDDEFIFNFKFLISELKRILKPGRLVAVHCKNLVNYKNRDGKSGLRDFRGDIIRAFLEYDFSYHSEVCIWKDPVIEMQRTKSHGLLYKQLRKDSSYSRQGLPDYLVIFRKWGEDVNPVNSKNTDNFKLDKWQQYASPVWFDIQQTNVLNKELARGENDEKHICPLQLDVIERAIELWTNPGDTVFTPFLGIGSEVYQALKMGRKGIGVELKREYFEKAVNFCLSAKDMTEDDVSLFDEE
jgi:superfamily II DNA or RNA helicase